MPGYFSRHISLIPCTLILCALIPCVLALWLAATPVLALQQDADLSDLSPQQRRAVEQMRDAGLAAQSVADGTPLGAQAGQQSDQTTGNKADTEIVTLPQFERLSGPADIVPVNLVHREGRDASGRYVTFAQAFRNGDLSPATPLGLRIGQTVFPVQRDIKALHGNGTVRHAVLTVDLEGLEARGERHQAMLVRSQGAELPPFRGTDPTRLVVSVAGRQQNGPGFAGDLDILSLSAAGQGEARPWLSGPFVREQGFSRQVGPLLTLRADHRVYADGSTRTRLIFENQRVFARGAHDMTYGVVIANEDQVVERHDAINHYRGSNWSTVIETGASPAWQVEQEPAYLIEARAIPPFDLSYGIAIDRIVTNQSFLTRQADVFAPGLLTRYFPTTGGRPEIGPLPAWDVAWLKTQNGDARSVMLEMAQTSGAVPWHFEDDQTGLPVRVDQRPLFWADARGAEEWRGKDRIPPDYFSSGDGGWALDTAHKPLLTYTAYLATGDAYFARELAHEAAFSIAAIWPDLRAGDAWVGEELQLRGRAWALRDVSAAAWLLPDAHPLKEYFTTARDGTLAHMAQKYIADGALDAAGETEGWFEDTSYRIDGAVPPWQNDYMVITLAQEALRGSADAAALVQWAENYQTGRFLDTGTSPTLGAAYAHMLNMPGTQDPVGTWAAMVSLTRNNPSYTENYPDYGAGYIASAYAALIMTHEVTGTRRSLQALGALTATQTGSALFDPANSDSIYELPQYLMAYPAPARATTGGQR